MNYIIFGGSGFIGTHLIKELKMKFPNGNIYCLDIVMPGEEGVVPGVVESIDGVHYIRCDVRNSIDFDIKTTTDDVVFNLAAVHRTPGHKDLEYFETNIKGAENVTAWCEKHNIKKVVFTSSIAPYGACEELKTEDSLPTPNTPYGISKLIAEKIHEKYQVKSNCELLIVRPGIVYGKGEHGNMTRLYAGIKKRYFFYTRHDTIKACIYVKELVSFILWSLENHNTGIYNCTFTPAYRIDEICNAMMKATKLHRFIPTIPARLLMLIAKIVGPLGGKKLGIHPARVKKLMISTNINGSKMNNCGYNFKYSLDSSFKDWFEDCDKQFLK